MITVLTIPTLLISIPSAARGVKSVGVECEDDWIDETSAGLGCLLIYAPESPNQESLFFEDAQKYCKNKDSRLMNWRQNNSLSVFPNY